ncbi:hypothetical protein PENTCL1PPCAC_17034, partial [Pristionchus entomophagus]
NHSPHTSIQHKMSKFEVEEILDKRTTKLGKVEYRIKWRGYTTPSWEEERNCSGCTDLIAQFEEKRKDSNGTAGHKVTSARRSNHAVDGSLATTDQPSSSRQSARGRSAAGADTTAQTSSMASRRSRMEDALEKTLTELISIQPSYTAPQGNRKRAASLAQSIAPAKILKQNELRGIKIWSFDAYAEWAETAGLDLTRALDANAVEMFLGHAVARIVAHYPHGAVPYFLIMTEMTKGKKVTDVIHAVDSILATRLFPSIVAQYSNGLAYSIQLGNMKYNDGAGPSTTRN